MVLSGTTSGTEDVVKDGGRCFIRCYSDIGVNHRNLHCCILVDQ